MALLNRAIRNAAAMMRAAEWGDSSIPPNSAGGSFATANGGIGTEQLALSISTVMACQSVIHNDVKLLPFRAYQGDPEGAHEPLRSQPQIVEEPFGPDVEPGTGMAQLAVSKSMRGNGYVWVADWDRLGLYPVQVTVLHPDAVKPDRDSYGRKVFRIGGETYGPDRVKHITGLMPPGAVAGVDPLTLQRTNLDLARKVGLYADAFFGGGGSPAGVISVPGPGDRRKAREVRDAWDATHGGVTNAHKAAIVFGGATWTPMSVTPENAQFLQTRRFLREEICGWYGVPLQRIQAIVENASQGGGAGLDAIDHGYIAHTLLGLVTDLTLVWNRMIPGGAGTWTAFSTDRFEKVSLAARASIDVQYRTAGLRTIDELRAREGLAPLPNGEGASAFVPMNSNAVPTVPPDQKQPGGATQ